MAMQQQLQVCSRCGTQVVPGQRFCAGCGSPLVPAATFCLSCGANMPPASKFCTTCGANMGRDKQQASKEPKPTSGRAKFGSVLFALGVLCIIGGPVVILIMSPTEQSYTPMIPWVVAGLLGIIIGLPLMFRD